MANTNKCKECDTELVYAKGLCRNCYSRREYNKKRLLDYIIEHYKVSDIAINLIRNILCFVGENYIGRQEQCIVLCSLLNNTIGISEIEIKKVYM